MGTWAGSVKPDAFGGASLRHEGRPKTMVEQRPEVSSARILPGRDKSIHREGVKASPKDPLDCYV